MEQCLVGKVKLAKKIWGPKFEPNGPKSCPTKIRFFVCFFKFGSLVFLELHRILLVEVKPMKKIGGPKLGPKLEFAICSGLHH